LLIPLCVEVVHSWFVEMLSYKLPESLEFELRFRQRNVNHKDIASCCVFVSIITDVTLMRGRRLSSGKDR
jgi:hypothetical protein